MVIIETQQQRMNSNLLLGNLNIYRIHLCNSSIFTTFKCYPSQRVQGN